MLAGFGWSKARLDAAWLVAEDRLSNAEIAERVGITRQGLDKWKRHPVFRAKVDEHIAELESATSRLAIAKRRNRLAVLDTIHSKLLTVIDERAARYADLSDSGSAADDDHAHMTRVAAAMFGSIEETTVPPGGETGLVVRQVKMIGNGPGAKIVEEYAVDTGLIREIRAIHEQAAKELGQAVERREVTGADGGPLQILVGMAHAELERRFEEIATRALPETIDE